MKYIKLPRRIRAVVDAGDYEKLASYRWHLRFDPKADGSCKVYPATSVYVKGGNPKTIMMHRMVAGYQDGMTVDHINGNTLDNRKENLRIVTQQQNSFNTQAHAGFKTSKYKGVSSKWVNKDGTQVWRARIRHNHKLISIGSFRDPMLAAKAYDEKARELFGVCARLNFPQDGEQGALIYEEEDKGEETSE